MQHALIVLLSTAMCMIFQFSLSAKEALLQTSIHAIPLNNPHSTQEHVQPGTLMELQAAVKNIGKTVSQAGSIKIRFAYPKPLRNQNNSIIFETESLNLPSIEPGKQVYLDFKRKHRWPSLFEFIRNDWAMREYQAVVEIKGNEEIIGALTIAFSAYYYEGARMERPVKVLNR